MSEAAEQLGRVKYMPIREFIDVGFLQEANRLFFHPRGLALQVSTGLAMESKESAPMQVWDYREDPEGMEFAEDVIDPQKAQRVEGEAKRHAAVRIDKWPPRGIQPA